jgi:hypothetical protein
MKSTTTIPYGRISLFFVLILAMITWGFYKTYLIFFPSFSGFKSAHHFHGAMMMLWMLMLIIQPLLIRYNKIFIHRVVGRLSFIVAPLVVVSIFLMSETAYHKPEPPLPYNEKIGLIALSIPSMLAFAALYILAILNRRHTYHHFRYMIGTALLMIGPGLGRALIIYFNVPFPTSVTFVLFLIAVIAVLLLLSDLLRKKSYTAFAIISVINTLVLLAWEFRMTQPWQSIGKFIANNFF